MEIVENTAWSCVHGVDRWREDCGCHTGGEPGWTQEWRAPLREALDWLRDELAPLLGARRPAEFFADPWAARDGYVERAPRPLARRASTPSRDASRQALRPREPTGCGRSSCWSCSATPC